MKATRFLQNGAICALLLTLTLSAVGQSITRFPGRHKGFMSAQPHTESGAPPASSKWTLLFPTTILDERFAAASVYDAPTNSLIVFGCASTSQADNDVMALA